MRSSPPIQPDLVVDLPERTRWAIRALGLAGIGALCILQPTSFAGVLSDGLVFVSCLALLASCLSLLPSVRIEVKGYELRRYRGSRLKTCVDTRDVERLKTGFLGVHSVYFASGAKITFSEFTPGGYHLYQLLSVLLEVKDRRGL